MTTQISRRGLLTSLGSLFIAAPAIVRASSLMSIKGVPLTFDGGYPELVSITRSSFVPRLFVQLWRTSDLDEPLC